MSHKASPPKKSDNPRYYSTGAKLDIRKSVDKWNDGLTYEERGRMWKQQAAIKAGIKPSSAILSRMEELSKVNKVVAQIKDWYELHGVIRLSQLNYIENV